MTNDESLRLETEIIWLEPIAPLPYVREQFIDWSNPRRRPRFGTGRIVGYAVVRPDGRREGYRRRVFRLQANDRPYLPDGPYRDGFPTDAVDPLTVAPGVLGTHPRIAQQASGAGPAAGCPETHPTARERHERKPRR